MLRAVGGGSGASAGRAAALEAGAVRMRRSLGDENGVVDPNGAVYGGGVEAAAEYTASVITPGLAIFELLLVSVGPRTATGK